MNIVFEKIIRRLPLLNLPWGGKCIGVSKLSLLRCLHVRGTNNIIEMHSRLSKDVQIYIYGNIIIW